MSAAAPGISAAAASLTATHQFVRRQRNTPHSPSDASSFTDRPPKIETFPRGYPSLSAFLSCDSGFAMFRIFGRLNTRLLLHKQDELVQLEERLDQLDRDQSAINPYFLTTNRRSSANAAAREALFAELEVKLKDYNTLLSSFLALLERPMPEEAQVKNVVNWMDGKKPLVRTESSFLHDWSDLRRAAQPAEKGGLEVLLAKCATSSSLRNILKLFPRLDSPSKSDDPNIQLLDPSKVMAASRSLAAAFAVFALVVPIVVLYSIQAIASRLWVVSGFTVIFSSALRWLTLSRNYEIFSATAAYCAVMVVFVGNLPAS